MCRPLRFIVTAGQVGDITNAPALFDGQTGDAVLADKAYDSNAPSAHRRDRRNGGDSIKSYRAGGAPRLYRTVEVARKRAALNASCQFQGPQVALAGSVSRQA